MKLYLRERKNHNNKSVWDVFADEGILVGQIEPIQESWYTKGKYRGYHQDPDSDWDRGCGFPNNEAMTVFEAKILFEKYLSTNPSLVEKIKKKNCKGKRTNIFDVKFLPESEEAAKDFFPTPDALAGRMLSKARRLDCIRTVLEPSAGLGDLAEVVKKAVCNGTRRYNRENVDIDVIEIDGNLQKILSSKCYLKLVHDDFLTYSTHKKYDLIAMNPPFSKGAEHLLKAMDMQRKTGGQIVCLLNAETIRNPYTIVRQQLCNELLRLGKTNYSIEFVSNAFSKAKRTTDVEVAIVYCNFVAPETDSAFFEKMEKAEEFKRQESECREIMSNDRIEASIQQYKVECAAGIELIKEYRAMMPRILTSMTNKTYNKPIIELKIDGSECDENRYLKAVRLKYWEAFFHNDDFLQNLTSQVRDEFHASVREMADYEYSRFNINKVLIQMASKMISGCEETIMKLFDELSAEHAYFPECKNNVWLYSGWKTNKAHKVNYKCIVPCYGIYTDRSWNSGAFNVYNAYKFLADIEKCLNYLDGMGSLDVNLERQLQYAASAGVTKNIHCKYFDVTFYKKGTCHITFTNRYIVDVLNIYAANNRSWLPPSYGKVKYEDMSEEEKSVIDEFQGKEAYDKVLANASLYLSGPSLNLPLLGA